ncbi:MAG: acyltransferase family protein [Bacteroidales bacterium]|jgi:surface polysaccharide O-acyltransferase-like enzyme|nr:acyltransferase family protein [Bacteroidales bacterium]
MEKENLFWIDCLRVLATFCVILLHTAASILYQYGNISNFNWWVGNIYDGIVRFCVPVFLLISGALILPKTYSNLKEYLNKRVLRIVLPFLFWSIIYISESLFKMFRNNEILSFEECVKYFLTQIRDGASHHLWYVYLIIGLYLVFPLISKWLKNSNFNEIKYFIIIWGITILAHFPIVRVFLPNIELQYFSGYIGFPILGYLFMVISCKDRKKMRLISILLILVGTFITIFGTFILTKQKGYFVHSFYDYLSPNVTLTAVGVFLFFRYSDFNVNKIFSSVIQFFSKFSYGVYLVHVLILSYLEMGFSHLFINNHPIINIPITSLLCFAISTIIVWFINKLPYGKYISG